MANEKTLYRAMSGDTYTDVEVLAQEAEDKAVAKSRVTWRIPGGVGGSMKYAADRATVEALFDGEVSTTPSPKTTVEPETTTPEPTEAPETTTPEPTEAPETTVAPEQTATITLTIENGNEEFAGSFTNFDDGQTIYAGEEGMTVGIPYSDYQGSKGAMASGNILMEFNGDQAIKITKNGDEFSSFSVAAYVETTNILDTANNLINMNNVEAGNTVNIVVTIVENSEANLETEK